MPWYHNKETGGLFNTDYIDEDEKIKERQIEQNKLEAQERASEEVNDPLNGKLGKRRKIDNSVGRIYNLQELNAINPHFNDPNQPKEKDYKNNCSMCTLATILSTMGYDVEAGTQPDANYRYDVLQVIKADYSDTNNYIMPGGNWEFDGGLTNRSMKGKIADCLKQKSGLDYKEFWESPDSPLKDRDNIYNHINRMPARGSAQKSAQFIQNIVQSWGKGGLGEIAITWQNGNSHSMLIFNTGKGVSIYDAQNNEIYTDLEYIMEKCIRSHTQVIRFDNNLGISESNLDSMLKAGSIKVKGKG